MDTLGVEIDPKLFITCRLCLEDDGVYQILPLVQEQISYCFSIIVEPFDGLPQLLCKKCKLLLNEYAANKRTFIEKQEALKKKFKEKLAKDNSEEKQETKVPINNKHKNRRISTSSDNSDSINLAKKKKKLCKTINDWKKDYVKMFTCRFCTRSYKNRKSLFRHCKHNHCHIRSKHRKMLDLKCMVNLEKIDNKPNITGSLRTVMLRKDKIVQDEGNRLYYIVYFAQRSPQNKVESDIGMNNSNKGFSDSSDDVFVSNKKRKRLRLHSGSSTDTVVIGDNKRKIYGENVMEMVNKSNIKDTDMPDLDNIPDADMSDLHQDTNTICIDDTSDSDTELNSYTEKGNRTLSLNNKFSSVKTNSIQEKDIDDKIINEIISVCRRKYEARRKSYLKDNATAQVESQLKHKILSIGRKVISKQTGFYNCTGLLRYLEHKNLNVAWEAKSQAKASFSKEANMVRMLIKNSKPKAAIDESGWTEIKPDKIDNKKPIPIQPAKNSNVPQEQGIKKPHILQQQQIVQNQMQNLLQSQIVQQPQVVFQQPQLVVQQPQIYLQQPNIVVQQPQIFVHQQNEQHPQIVPQSEQSLVLPQPQFIQQSSIIQQQPQNLDQAVLYTNVVDESNIKKLLNPNPVANPKQLPKKPYSNDTKSIVLSNIPNMNNESIYMDDEIDETNMVLPVITSTTSLANLQNDDNTKSKSEDNHISNNSDKSIPRIKVKPFSELMKPSMVNVSQPNNILDFNQVQSESVINEGSLNIFVPNNLVSQIQSQSTPMVIPNFIPADTASPEPKKNTDCIILDTVDFPNTKTDSPFKYFRNLLLLHEIILTEANATLSREFVCLLKFKVQFKQENKNLTLCLSLFCSDNKFCMSVKDGNFINIHMGKMSANWQWEILKVYQGDVTNKILQNAQKAGHNIFMKTKTFLTLLKSINQKHCET